MQYTTRSTTWLRWPLPGSTGRFVVIDLDAIVCAVDDVDTETGEPVVAFHLKGPEREVIACGTTQNLMDGLKSTRP